MKSFLLLGLYLQTWAVVFLFLSMIGLVLWSVTVAIFLFAPPIISFNLSLYAYTALALPYVFMWYPFRQLLANRQLALLPYFRLKLGLTLLLLTLALALYPVLSARLFAPGTVSWALALRIFFFCSLGFGVLQWLCTQARLGFICVMVSLSALGFVFYAKWRALIWALLQLSGFDLELLVLSILGWLAALRSLTAQRRFAPPTPLSAYFDKRATIADDFNSLALLVDLNAQPRTATGTLLLGYPDTWRNRVNFYCRLLFFVAFAIAIVIALQGDVSDNGSFATQFQRILPFAGAGFMGMEFGLAT
ncbi:MAG: hypothetical protein LBF16_06500, partial [Pseudomonadales bacterium]|nr:hypothetical protein [Pseudomonadales bacterium]